MPYDAPAPLTPHVPWRSWLACFGSGSIRRAAKALIGVVLATDSQLPASMPTLPKTVNLFCKPAHQA